MATFKPKPPKPKIPKLGTNPNPSNYLRGSKKVGEKYTAYDSYGQGKPDFGKGAGPGTPYHEVQKTVQKAIPGAGKPVTPGPPPRNFHLPKWIGSGGAKKANPADILKNARARAIRNRLNSGQKAAY